MTGVQTCALPICSLSGLSATTTSTSTSFSLARFVDAGSGVATETLTEQRAAVVSGACPLSGSPSWQDVTTLAINTSETASGLATGYCYRFVYTTADKVGNTAAATSSAILVDTVTPNQPTLAFDQLTNSYWDGSGTLYFNSALGGSYRVTATADAPASGIASYDFTVGGGHGFTPSGTGSQRSYSYGVGATSTTGAATVTSGAGAVSSAASYTLTADGAAPSDPEIGRAHV